MSNKFEVFQNTPIILVKLRGFFDLDFVKKIQKELNSDKISSRILNNGTIIKLKIAPGEIFLIPSFVSKILRKESPKLCLEVAESGGWGNGLGCATVVCGLSGKKLKPYYRTTARNGRNIPHALFSPVQSVVTVTAILTLGGARQLCLNKYFIKNDKQSSYIVLKNEELWNGDDKLPPKLDKFKDPIRAAFEKATKDSVSPFIHFAM